MKKLFIIALILSATANLWAQEDIPEMKPDREILEDTSTREIFVVVEEMPEFPGGDSKMYEFINKNVNYPDSAKKYNVQGRVIVQFVVNEDGSLSDVRIVKKLGWGFDEEVIRVIKLMPKWKPGKQRGKPVKVRYTLPVKFELN